MAVNPVASTTDTSASSTGRNRLVESYDTFMTLLTAQIQNQDPLKPMDSTQFTQQLVQMTGVEQQLLTNDLLEKLVTNTGSGIQTSVGLLGREVKAAYDTAKLTNGKAEWNYKLDRDASNVSVEVLDDKGRVVKVLQPTDNKAGDKTIVWDGQHRNGPQMPNGGLYTIRITAKDSTGASVTATPFVKGKVTGVEQNNGKTLITVNGVQVGWEKVTSIAEAAAAQQTAQTNATSTTNTTADDEDETPPVEKEAA